MKVHNEEYTELGNGKRFVKIAGEEFKWVPEIKGWFRWNGTLWEEDRKETVMRVIEDVLESIKLEMAAMVDDYETIMKHPDSKLKGSVEFAKGKEAAGNVREASGWYKRSQSGKTIREMVGLARTQKGMTKNITEFDSKGHYVGCKNGIVDLRDGSLITNDKRYLITKSVGVNYDENATSELWEEQLLKYMQGNKEYADFLQVLLGSSMVGHKSKWFTMFYGEKGGNGKSTIVDTVSAVLGDYAKVGDPKVVLGGSGSKSEYYLAAFKGTRFLIFNESNKEEVQMSEHLIKMVTDSGEVQARHPAGRPFEYQPVFTPVFCVNHLPTVSMDPAVWRRLLILPFEYQIPVDEQDSGFVDKLIKNEGSGILNWLVDGAIEFLKNGLNPPVSLKAQTQELRKQGDTLTQFIDQNCTVTGNDEDRIKLNDLRKQYIEWLLEHGYKKTPAAQRFARDMRDCGFIVKVSTEKQNWVYGIKEGQQLYAVSGRFKPTVQIIKDLMNEE